MGRWSDRGRRGAALIGAAVAVACLSTSPGANAATLSATEGQQFTAQVPFLVDCTASGVTIDWGDGTPQSAATDSGGQFSGTHTYTEEGTYTATVRCSGSTRGTFTESVADAPLAASGRSLTAPTGESFSGTVATLSDLAGGSDAAGVSYSATIDWGDGTSSSGSVSPSGGGLAVSGTHTYAATGSYPVTVTLTDDGGASAVAHGTASVSPAAPQARFTAPPSLATGALESFDASGSRPPGAQIESFRWSLDGRPVADCAGSTSQLQTRFLAPGAHALALAVTAASGVTTTTQTSFSVGGPGVRPGGRLPRGTHLIRSQQTFSCLRAVNDPSAQILPPSVLPQPNAGCESQVQAGIVDATGCLTEYQDTLTIDHSTFVYKGRSYQLSDLGTFNQPLRGVPATEARQLLLDINASFETVPCEHGIPCPQMQAAGSYYGSNPLPEHAAADLAPRRTAGAPAQTAATRGTLPPDPRNYLPGAFLQTPCSQQPEPEPGDTPSHACLDLWVSSGPVDINGVTYVPGSGAVVLIAPQFNLVISADAAQDVGDLRAQPGRFINYQLPPTGQPPGQDFPALDAADLPALIAASPDPAAARREFGSVGGFATDPGSALHIGFSGPGSAELSFQVDLPPPFSDGHGGRVAVTVSATISDTQGLQVIDGYLGGISGSGGVSVDMGAVQLSDFGVCFRHQASGNPALDPCPGVTGIPEQASFGSDFWDASGQLAFGGFRVAFRPGAGGVCSPPPPALGIGFGAGGLAFAGADLQTPGIPIAPGVSFDQLAAGFTDTPGYDTLGGCAVISAGDGLVRLTGNLFAAFAKNGGSYRFTGGELPDMQAPYPYTNDFAFGVGGSVTLELPVLGSTQLAGGYVIYVDDPAALFFGAAADFSVPFGTTYEHPPGTGIALKAGINGAIGLASGFPPPFYVQGEMAVIAQAPLGNRLQGSLQGIISDDPHTGAGGIAVCGTASVELGDVNLGTATAGFGYHWGDDVSHMIQDDVHVGGSCSDQWYTAFAVNVQSARATPATPVTAGTATATHTFRVPPGAAAVDLRVIGRGGAPDITLTGPRGLRASTAALAPGRARRVDGTLLARGPTVAQTLVVLEHPAAGRYRITADPGSPPIAGVRESVALAPRVVARVSGHGIARRLSYRIARRPGQVVVFIERSRQADRVLGSTRRARGTIPFRAATGHGRRQIVAEVLAGGAPSAVVPVTSYRAPRLQRLGRVRWVHIRRLRNRATVTFAAVPGARRYELQLTLRDGTRRLYRTSGRRLAITGLYLEVSGRALVRAEGDSAYTASGAPTAARIAAWLRPLRRRG